MQYSKNSKEQNFVDWTERLKSTYNCPIKDVNDQVSRVKRLLNCYTVAAPQT